MDLQELNCFKEVTAEQVGSAFCKGAWLLAWVGNFDGNHSGKGTD